MCSSTSNWRACRVVTRGSAPVNREILSDRSFCLLFIMLGGNLVLISVRCKKFDLKFSWFCSNWESFKSVPEPPFFSVIEWLIYLYRWMTLIAGWNPDIGQRGWQVVSGHVIHWHEISELLMWVLVDRSSGFLNPELIPENLWNIILWNKTGCYTCWYYSHLIIFY